MVELKTIAVNIMILLIFLNAGPAALQYSGVAKDMGLDPAVGGDKTINDTNREMRKNVSAEGGFGSTLFSLYTTASDSVVTMTKIVTAGPTMALNAGLPDWLVAFVFAPQYIIVGATILYMVSGRLL